MSIESKVGKLWIIQGSSLGVKDIIKVFQGEEEEVGSKMGMVPPLASFTQRIPVNVTGNFLKTQMFIVVRFTAA